MPPPNKKDLLLKNLDSIFSEVRKKSYIQLFDFIGISKEDKIKLYQKGLGDADEANQALAREYIAKFGETAPASPPPQQSPVESPVESLLPPLEPEPPPPPLPPVARKTPLPPPPQPVPESTPEPVSVPEPPGEVAFPTDGEVGRFRPDGEVFKDPPPSDEPVIIEAPPLEEEMDGVLPNIESLKSIPQRLEHIKYLSREKPAGHITQMLQLACDQIEEVSLTALQALLKTKDPRVPPQVLPMLTFPGFSSQRRFLVLKIIMETKSEIEISHLEIILLAEKDVIVKSGLVKVFARIAGENGVVTLKKCLFDPDPRVRANTVEVIEEQGLRGCNQEIVKLLNDPENRVKVNTAKYLVKMGYSQAFGTLKAMLGSSEVWLRDSVIFALGEIGDQSSLTLLKAALKDPNQGIRLSVLKALAKVNNMPARESLQGAENDPDQVVAQVARSLWEKIKDTPPAAPKAPLPPMPMVAEKIVIPSITPPPPPPKPVPTPEPEKISLPSVELESPETPPVTPRPIPKPAQLPSRDGGVPGAPKPPPLPKAPPPPAVEPETISTEPVEPPTAPPPKPRPPQPVIAPRPPIPETPASPQSGKTLGTTPPAPPQPLKPVTPKPPGQTPKPPVPAGATPQFQKARSGETWAKLCSGAPDMIQAAMKDLPFIVGDDQLILLTKAVQVTDDSVRLAAAKILSRRRGQPSIDLMKTLVNDQSEIVSTFAQKALTLMK